MFHYADVFNQDISNWDVSNVTNMTGVFAECRNFNQDISSWDVSKATSMHGMFYQSNFNNDISNWDPKLKIQNCFKKNLNFNENENGTEIYLE